VVSFEISSHSHALLSQEGSAIEDGARGGSEWEPPLARFRLRGPAATSHRAVPLTQGDVAAHYQTLALLDTPNLLCHEYARFQNR
jgi:hypothetical protein